MTPDKIQLIKTSNDFITNIVRKIENVINRKINIIEEDIIISAIRNTPDKIFYTDSIEHIITLIKNVVVDEITISHCDNNVVDTHEILKKKINPDYVEIKKKEHKKKVNVNLDSVFGYSDISTLIKKANEPISSVNNIHLLLDTRYRVLENDGTEYFKWNHIDKLVTAQGTVNSVDTIRDVISLHIMPYRIPISSSAITDYNLITVSIEEFTAQSFIAHENRRFHFLGCIDSQVGSWLQICSDNYNNGEYNFNIPITTVNTLTIKLGTPLEPIIFDKDRLNGTIVYSNPLIINFTEPHNNISTNVIYIDTFTTLNPGYDSELINMVNKKIGHKVTLISPTSLSIPVDASGVINTLTGTLSAPYTILPGSVLATINSAVIIGIGTSFITDFVVNDYIEVQNQAFQINSIQSDTQITLTEIYKTQTGNYTYRKTDVTVTGTGTLFKSEVAIGDNLVVIDGGSSPNFIIKSIQSDTTLTLETPYNGLNGAAFTINKNNSVAGHNSIYFGSKRIFIPIALKYLSV